MIALTTSIQLPQKDVVPLLSPVGIGNSISNTNPFPGVSPFVISQFPQFVSEDHPLFIQFMEAYYSWLDSKGKPLHEARQLLDQQDIDTASQEYEEHLFNEFLSILPRDILADHSLVLKYIKQFYGAKGTERSFKFLFRILFNTDSYLYYPKVDVLRASDGKWIQNRTVRLTNVVGDIKKVRAQKIRGSKTNTIAFVERFYGISFSNTTAYELVLNSSSITGEFEPGETVTCSFSEDDSSSNVTIITGTISPIVSKVKIIKSGKGYSLGDTLKIQDAYGEGAIIRVSEVDATGSIVSCNIKEYGIGYNVNNPPYQIKFIDDNHPELIPGTGQLNPDVAIVNIVLGSITEYPGYFRNSDGQVSTNKYIHDGYFYQQFSYVTYTDRSLSDYKDVMNRVVHPLGFKHFGGISLINNGKVSAKKAQEYTPIYRPHLVTLHAKARTKPVSFIRHQSYKSKNHLGPSYESIVRDKFSYKPFIKYDANREVIQNSPPYYGTGLLGKTASTPVSTFEIANVGVNKPKDIEQNRLKRIRLFPDSCIIQNSDRVIANTKHTDTKNVVSGLLGSTQTIQFEIINHTGQTVNWQIKKNGINIQQGSSSLEDVQISIDIFVESCRLALFVTDNLNREYKSNDVRIKPV